MFGKDDFHNGIYWSYGAAIDAIRVRDSFRERLLLRDSIKNLKSMRTLATYNYFDTL